MYFSYGISCGLVNMLTRLITALLTPSNACKSVQDYPFVFAGNYEMKARLRYRINKENQLEMWYERVRPQDIIEDAFNQAFAEIESSTGAEIINANI